MLLAHKLNTHTEAHMFLWLPVDQAVERLMLHTCILTILLGLDDERAIGEHIMKMRANRLRQAAAAQVLVQ